MIIEAGTLPKSFTLNGRYELVKQVATQEHILDIMEKNKSIRLKVIARIDQEIKTCIAEECKDYGIYVHSQDKEKFLFCNPKK